MNPRVKNRLLLVVTAMLFSTGGAAIKACSLGSWQVAGFRSGVAALAVFALVPASRRGLSWRVLPAATAYAATLILFVTATKLTTAANAIYLQATAPLYVLALGPVLLHERIRRSDLFFGAAVATGLGLFFAVRQGTLATAPNPARGDILALLSGVGWALPIPDSRWTDWMVILYLGLVQIGLAYYCLTRAIGHVPAFEATTLMLLEPALNPVWVWLIEGERPAALALCGGALILSATVVHTWIESRRAV